MKEDTQTGAHGVNETHCGGTKKPRVCAARGFTAAYIRPPNFQENCQALLNEPNTCVFLEQPSEQIFPKARPPVIFPPGEGDPWHGRQRETLSGMTRAEEEIGSSRWQTAADSEFRLR